LAKHLKLAFNHLGISALKKKKRNRPESWTILTALKVWRKRRRGNDGHAIALEPEVDDADEGDEGQKEGDGGDHGDGEIS
jgi:hypothetical protein